MTNTSYSELENAAFSLLQDGTLDLGGLDLLGGFDALGGIREHKPLCPYCYLDLHPTPLNLNESIMICDKCEFPFGPNDDFEPSVFYFYCGGLTLHGECTDYTLIVPAFDERSTPRPWR
eukprot:CFRG3133T1